MNTSNYEYFCGANVSLVINGNEQLDVAGISYQVTDSSTPIYGYASRTFDAVAPGQKLVRGNFVVNYTHYNAIAYSIARSKFKIRGDKPLGFDLQSQDYGIGDSVTGFARYNTIKDQHIQFLKENNYIVMESEEGEGIVGGIKDSMKQPFMDYVQRIMYSGTYDEEDAISLGMNLLEHFSIEEKPPAYPSDSRVLQKKVSTLDALLLGPFDIQILFGNPDKEEGFTIVNCYVNSIGGTIQISEDVILQEFSFYGRNVVAYK